MFCRLLLVFHFFQYYFVNLCKLYFFLLTLSVFLDHKCFVYLKLGGLNSFKPWYFWNKSDLWYYLHIFGCRGSGCWSSILYSVLNLTLILYGLFVRKKTRKHSIFFEVEALTTYKFIIKNPRFFFFLSLMKP